MNFRPVNTQTGPDGHLYIVDMYRGIIQESTWTKKGSYLRPKILERGMDKNIGKGRIYRLIYDGMKSDGERPKMLSQTSRQLVDYLEHPNGWWRDNAQKLLVLRGDTSVAGALRKMALGSTSDLGRIHALWTLDGLDALDLPTILAALDDKEPSVRKTAVWIVDKEKWKANDYIFAKLQDMKGDPSADVRLQLLLNMRFDNTERSRSFQNDLLARYPDDILAVSHKQFEERRVRRVQANKEKALLARADQQLVKRGAVIFKEFCASCHGLDGKGLSIGGGDAAAPALAENPDVSGDPDKLIKILLHGLTGPINGKTYLSLMPPMRNKDDDYIASVLSYIRSYEEPFTISKTPPFCFMSYSKSSAKSPPWKTQRYPSKYRIGHRQYWAGRLYAYELVPSTVYLNWPSQK